MSKNGCHDIAVLGLGIAGAFALHKITEKYKDAKVIGFELGRPPQKRRSQISGWLGCLINGDGKIYLTDTKKVDQLVGSKKAKTSNNWVTEVFRNVSDFETTKDRSPAPAAEKRAKKNGLKIQLNNYVQLYPKEIHALSKFISNKLETNKNLTFSFDNEVFAVTKTKNNFLIQTQEGEYKAKKVVIAVGRSGWRWAHQLFTNFGIVEDNRFAKFGVRIEMPATTLKDFNKSNCTLSKENIEVGPLCWNGTIIPEDHVDMAISAFRSNEGRWKTDKVSFSFIRDIPTADCGFEQTDRIGKLTFILSNDRIVKERVSTLVNGKSRISIIPEYNWLGQDMQDLSNVIPDLLNKAYFHVPTLVPLPSKINLDNNLCTEVEGLYVAGESMGVIGILAAAISGAIVGDAVCK
jgi:hypothetical protein